MWYFIMGSVRLERLVRSRQSGSLDKLMQVLGESYTSKSYAFLVDADSVIINHPNKACENAGGLGMAITRRMVDMMGGEIRKLDRGDAKTVPIIALTANAFEEDVQQCLQAGMNEHLSKPVDIDALVSTLGRLIAGGGKQKAPYTD